MFSALRRWRRRRQADRMTVSTAQWEQVEQSLPFLAWHFDRVWLESLREARSAALSPRQPEPEPALRPA